MRSRVLRDRDALQRVVKAARAIDPDIVEIFADPRHQLLAPPFGSQQPGQIHHLAQAKDQPCALRLEIGQRVLDLALQAMGSLSTIKTSGAKLRAVSKIIARRIFSVSDRSTCSASEVYSPLRSLLTLGTFTKSTRAR